MFYIYIYILDSALLISRTLGRVPHKSSEEVFQFKTKALKCTPVRHDIIYISCFCLFEHLSSHYTLCLEEMVLAEAAQTHLSIHLLPMCYIKISHAG